MVQQMGEEDSLKRGDVKKIEMINLLYNSLPSIGTGIKHTEALVQDTDGLVFMSWVVIGIVTLTHCETSLEI